MKMLLIQCLMKLKLKNELSLKIIDNNTRIKLKDGSQESKLLGFNIKYDKN